MYKKFLQMLRSKYTINVDINLDSYISGALTSSACVALAVTPNWITVATLVGAVLLVTNISKTDSTGTVNDPKN